MRGSPANDHDCTDIWSVVGILTDLKGFLSKSFQDPCTRALSRKLAWKQKKSVRFWIPTIFGRPLSYLPETQWLSTCNLNFQLMGNLAICRWQLVSKLSRFDPDSPTTPQPQLLQPWMPCATHEKPPYNHPHLGVRCALELDLIEFNAWLQQIGNNFYFLFTFILFRFFFYFKKKIVYCLCYFCFVLFFPLHDKSLDLQFHGGN